MSTEKTPQTMKEILEKELYVNIKKDVLYNGIKKKITDLVDNEANKAELDELKEELVNFIKKYQDEIPTISINKTFAEMLADKADKYIKKDQIEGLMNNNKISELEKNRKSQLETLKKTKELDKFIQKKQER
jgi:hypothetical protein